MTHPSRRFAEATTLGAAGVVLAGLCWSTVGLAVPAAVVGGANGALSGARGVYGRDRVGALAFALDSTWALATTTASVGVQLVDGALRASYLPALSRRQHRHAYRGGLPPRRG